MALIGSNLSAAALAQERDARTLDPLLLSALGPGRIVRGKFWAAFVATALVALAILPILLPIMSLGEIPFSTLAVALLGQLTFAAVVVASGLALSAHAESTRRISLLVVVLAFVGTLSTGGLLTAFGDAFRADGGCHIRGPYFFSEAYFLVPLSAKYALGLVVLPAYLVVTLLSLSYLAARAGLMSPAEDRTFALKCWAAATVTVGGGLLSLATHALHVAANDRDAVAAMWAVATAGLAFGLLFVFVAGPVARSRRHELRPTRGLARLLPEGVAPSVLFVMLGTAVALPAGVVAIVGLESDLVGRALWGSAYVGAIGSLVGLVAVRTAPARPTLARVSGVIALALTGIVAPIAASALEARNAPPSEINAVSPGWVLFHERAAHELPLVAGGMVGLALLTAVLATLMVHGSKRKQEQLAQRPAV
jgi:hypothetical protein